MCEIGINYFPGYYCIAHYTFQVLSDIKSKTAEMLPQEWEYLAGYPDEFLREALEAASRLRKLSPLPQYHTLTRKETDDLLDVMRLVNKILELPGNFSDECWRKAFVEKVERIRIALKNISHRVVDPEELELALRFWESVQKKTEPWNVPRTVLY